MESHAAKCLENLRVFWSSLTTALSIVLTVVATVLSLAFEAEAQQKCMAIVDNEVTRGLWQESVPAIRARLSKIQTESALINAFEELSRLARYGDTKVWLKFKEVDFLSGVRKQLKAGVRFESLESLLNEVALKTQDDREAWGSSLILRALEIAREPKEVVRLVDDYAKLKRVIQEDFLLGQGQLMNRTLAESLVNLPIESRRLLADHAKAKLIELQAKLPNEIPQAQEKTLKAPLRNVEFIWAVSRQKRLRALMGALDSTPVSERIGLLDRFLSEVTYGERGNYSFARNLEIASELQKGFQVFLEKKGAFVEIVGSYPNGKAKRDKSDIDLMVNLPFKFALEDMHKADRAAAVNLLDRAEAQVAERLKIPVKPGELLNINHYQDELYQPARTFLLSYNSLAVRVSREKTSLIIYDFLAEPAQEREFEGAWTNFLRTEH